MRMGTKLSLLQKSGKGGLGWQTPKPTSESFSPTRNTETPSKTSSNPELSEAPRHTEVYPRNTNWSIPNSNKKARGSRNGKTEL